jgi:hypothetical protein
MRIPFLNGDEIELGTECSALSNRAIEDLSSVFRLRFGEVAGGPERYWMSGRRRASSLMGRLKEYKYKSEIKDTSPFRSRSRSNNSRFLVACSQ